MDNIDDLFNRLNLEHQESKQLEEGFKALHRVYNAMLKAGFEKEEAITFIVKMTQNS